MSELKSVLAFFLGLVFFVIIIGLALGRIHLPKNRSKTQTITEQTTPTPTPMARPTKKPGLMDKIAGVFKKDQPSPTPKPLAKTPRPTPEIKETETPLTEMKEALSPEEPVGGTIINKGGQVISVDKTPTAPTGETIPESGAPTLLIPLSLLLARVGQKLRRSQ